MRRWINIYAQEQTAPQAAPATGFQRPAAGLISKVLDRGQPALQIGGATEPQRQTQRFHTMAVYGAA